MAATRVPIVERTPIAKKSVRAREPKYAIEKGRRSFEMMCFRSGVSYGDQACSLRAMGPWRIAKPSMNRHEPRVNASANFRGLIATGG